jgi:hypothetical protein
MRSAARALALVIAGFAVGAGLVSSPISAHAAVPVAPGQIGIKLLDASASQQNDPRAHEYIVDQLPAGASLTRHVEVSNLTKTSQQITVYAAGASVGDGSFTFADGTTPDELSSWTSLSASTLSLRAGQAATVAVTIAVPAGATSGERYAVIWAQASSAPTLGAVSEINRVGIRVYLEVAGTPQPSNFTIDTFVPSRTADAKAQLTVTVHNTGDRTIDVNGPLTLSDGPAGAAVPAPIAAEKVTTIAAGDSQPVRFMVGSAVANGPWKATVALSSGELIESASASITFPGRSGAAAVLPPVPPTRSGSSVPKWLIITTALTAGAIVVGLALGRRGHRSTAATVATGHRSVARHSVRR